MLVTDNRMNVSQLLFMGCYRADSFALSSEVENLIPYDLVNRRKYKYIFRGDPVSGQTCQTVRITRMNLCGSNMGRERNKSATELSGR